MKTPKAFLIGLGAAYLFDPRSGRRRRRVARDRTLKLGRRARRVGTRKVRFTQGRLRGLLASVRPQEGHARPVDDATVAQRVRSDALRDVGLSTRQVHVDVDDGIVALEGTVGSPELVDELIARVSATPGVKDVAAVLRVTRRAA